mgnify:CR=1 FL=1
MHKLFSIALFVFILGYCSGMFGQCKAINLNCENLVNPLGIDSPSPRLKWQLNDSRAGALQKGYQVLVSTDSASLLINKADMWNSNHITGSNMQVVYNGKQLKPFTKYYWKVFVWDKDGKKSQASIIASFETGMMNMKNWQGKWITDSRDSSLKPASYFRKDVALHGNIKSARVYIAVAGLYELFINGQRVGDHRLDPMYTRFDKRTLYVTYDVTSMLGANKNAIGVLLGNGWYNLQSTASWDIDKAGWRARPRFCLNLRVTYSDNHVETFFTDDSWKTSLSPIVFNSIYTGEHQDARLEQDGWNKPGFNDSNWKTVLTVSPPSNNITAQVLQPIRFVEEITPKSCIKINSQKYIYDLGKNIAGISKITVKGDAGTMLTLKHSELLDSAGNVDQSNIILDYKPTNPDDPFHTDIYILNGKGEETFWPRFNYKGFQYVEVTSTKPVELTKESLKGIVMHSDVQPVGSFECSNPTINKINLAADNSYLANLFGYPTDCPQREKNGWTGDAHIISETGMYNFDGITVYEKWLADHRDEQQPNGVLPAIIPTYGWGYEWGNGPDWTSTIVIIPWNIYLFYGDIKPLADCYNNIKLYVDHITEISPNGTTDWGLGDWSRVKSKTPKELTSTIYYYADALLLAKAAKLFNKQDDYNRYMALSAKIANAFNAKYLNKDTGIYDVGYQTELCAPLYWGLVPDNMKDKVVANLVKRVIADDKHIDIGLLGSKAIFSALSNNGHADLAYEVAAQETYPSWGLWVKQGATTLFENWHPDATTNNSRNHIMFGDINAWFYRTLGGILPDTSQPGFKNIILKPFFVSGLTYCNSQHNSPYGKIVSNWKRINGLVYYHTEIPANSTASLTLVGKSVKLNGKTIMNKKPIKLVAGTYDFVIEN